MEITDKLFLVSCDQKQEQKASDQEIIVIGRQRLPSQEGPDGSWN